MRPRSNRGLFVLFLSSDSTLTFHVIDSAEKTPDIVIVTELGEFHDVAVLPASMLVVPLPAVPTIGYGPAEALAPCFSIGCRDYLRDPWSPDELFVRARNCVPYTVHLPGGTTTLCGSTILAGRLTIRLTPAETTILRALVTVPDVVPRKALTLLLWNREPDDSRMLDMHVSRLRAKLKTASSHVGGGCDIVAARNHGYVLL